MCKNHPLVNDNQLYLDAQDMLKWCIAGQTNY